MSIDVVIRHRLGDFVLDAAFRSSGRLTALFGASGSGKTSVINAIAGLIRPDFARIAVDDDVLIDTGQRRAVPVHRRRIGYVFQDARLFPHLTVEQNLAYGRWFTPKLSRYADQQQIIALLGIGHLLPRKPAALSGGEKQRVAIGRALLSSPRLLLMDEPLASLDQARKAEIMPYIERLRDQIRIPIIYVSHSVAEVSRLATDIVVLADGHVAAAGPTPEIAQRLDLIPADERDEGGVVLDMVVRTYNPSFDMTVLGSAAGLAQVQGQIAEAGRPVRVHVRARDVMIAIEEPKGISALNVFRGIVAGIENADRSSVTVRMDCGGTPVLARITRQSATALGLTDGMPVYAVIKAVSVARPGAAPEV